MSTQRHAETARHAKVGDRMEIETDTGTAVVTVDRVTRLGCGCDRAEADRPGGGPCPRVHLLASTCGHRDGIDFDAARQAAERGNT